MGYCGQAGDCWVKHPQQLLGWRGLLTAEGMIETGVPAEEKYHWKSGFLHCFGFFSFDIPVRLWPQMLGMTSL